MLFRAKRVPNGDVLYNIYDKTLCQNDVYFFKNQHALELAMYHDDLEVCNLFDSKIGEHKVDMLCYSIISISPKFHSKHCTVCLLVICNTKSGKKCGTKKFFLL